ncbi:MAG TPA: SCO5918 family protein [Solirubrobacteraceae bacterium]|jgi:hypothetical protein|nr:SCO5918 family protein [Solirubrobacteraceae bacterium]
MTETKSVTVAKHRFDLRRSDVERAMRRVLPDPIMSHYVVIGRRRYPPKQVIGVVTGLDRADFASHQARRILAGLGFATGRRSPQDRSGRSSTAPAGGGPATRVRRSRAGARASAETLEPFVGQWVATRGEEVLVAAPDPRAVVSWLAGHRQQADSMFRVPVSEFEASGAAPL